MRGRGGGEEIKVVRKVRRRGNDDGDDGEGEERGVGNGKMYGELG